MHYLQYVGEIQRSAESTKAIILETAIELIEKSANNSLRIEDVVDQCGLTFPTIYFHFGDRAGLVRAAQVEIFKRSFSSETDTFATFARSVTELDVLIRAVFFQILKNCNDSELTTQRHQRLRVMSNAITDNALMRDVLALQAIPIGKLESIFIDLVDRGVVNMSLDCAAYARWLLGLLAGRVLIEIDPTYDSQALDHILALAIVIPLLRDDDDENLISELTDLVTSQIAINSKKYQTDTGLKASKDIDAVSIELLELVSQQIARGGESSIRLTQIAGQAKISVGSITRRYRTRDQLIDASLARDFTKLSMESATALGARLTELRNRKQLVDVINKLLSENANNPDYVRLRIQRIQILGLALSRPNLAKEITSSLHKFENAIQPGVKHLQSEDILGAPSQPFLLLTLNQIMQLGRVVVDFNHISDPNDAWLHMSQRVSQFVIDKLA